MMYILLKIVLIWSKLGTSDIVDYARYWIDVSP